MEQMDMLNTENPKKQKTDNSNRYFGNSLVTTNNIKVGGEFTVNNSTVTVTNIVLNGSTTTDLLSNIISNVQQKPQEKKPE